MATIRYCVLHVYLVTWIGVMSHVGESSSIRGSIYSDHLKSFANKAGFSDMQRIYKEQTFTSDPIYALGLVTEISGSVSSKFNTPITAAQRIKDVVEAEESKFTSSPSMSECCRVSGLTYDSRFRTEVSTDKTCVLISSTASDNAAYPTSAIESAMKENHRKNPSLKWQYFASEDGYYQSYPALKASSCGNYDPRYRPFYVQTATPASKDVVVIIDKSGSMTETHNGKTLQQIAKEAAVSVVETLNPNDRVSIVTFSSGGAVLGKTSRACLSENLAMGTPHNQKFLKAEIAKIRSGGSTNYEAALNEAFNVFDKSHKLANESEREKVILFLTDGKKTVGGNPLTAIADRNKKLNNRVIIFTYALGLNFDSGDKQLLQDMANQVNTNASHGEIKKGEYRHIEDPSKLRTAMASYYNRFSSSEKLTNAVISVPYQDLFGIGLISSVCYPVYRSTGNLMGVACSDVTLSDLLSSLTYFQQGELSYTFLIDGMGRTLMHPLMPQPSSITDSPLFVHISHLERQSGSDEVIKGMMWGGSGNKTLISLRTAPRGDVLYEGIETTTIKSDYSWKPIDKTNLSVALVLAQTDKQSRMQPINSNENAVHYHRLDLVSPGQSACRHFNRYATRDYSVVMLTPAAFRDPFKYLDVMETVSDVYKYEEFLKGRSSTNPGLKESIKDTVTITYKAEELWKTDNDAELFVWRYIGTKDGVMRVFPGAVLPKNYDHKRRPWYMKAVALKNKYVMSSPYVDRWGSGLLVTMSKTITQENDPATPILGVIGTDFRLPYLYQTLLDTYSACKQDDLRCFLMDSSGYIVVHEDFVNGNPNEIENVHVVFKERAIAVDLLLRNYMTRESCLDLENIKQQFTYKVSLSISGANHISDHAGYEIQAVPDSNLFVVIKVREYRSPSKPCCTVYNVSPADRSCASSDCDCICHKTIESLYNYCTNDYTLGDVSPTCSPRPPPLQTLTIDDAEQSKHLKMCYDSACSKKTTKAQCHSVSSCDYCFRNKDDVAIHSPFCGTVYQCTLGIVGQGLGVCTGDKCDTEDKGKGNGGAIAGGIIGVIVGVGVVMFVIIFAKRKDALCFKPSCSSDTAATHSTGGATGSSAQSSAVNNSSCYQNPSFSEISTGHPEKGSYGGAAPPSYPTYGAQPSAPPSDSMPHPPPYRP